MVDSEEIIIPTWLVQAVVFVNAKGLETDLTGLRLRNTDERQTRINEAMNSVVTISTEETSKFAHYISEREGPNSEWYLSEMKSQRDTEIPKKLAIVIGLAVVSLALPPLLLLSVPVATYTIFVSSSKTPNRNRASLETWARVLKRDLEALSEDLEISYPHPEGS